MVSVLWQGVGERSWPPVLDPQVLAARHVCKRYRRRWRLEEAFALPTRRVALAYVWTGARPAVPWQRLSVELGVRAGSHERRAAQRGARDQLVACLADHATRLGIVKRHRKAPRECQPGGVLMGGDPSVETGASATAPPFMEHVP
jgi:hypothetical protein